MLDVGFLSRNDGGCTWARLMFDWKKLLSYFGIKGVLNGSRLKVLATLKTAPTTFLFWSLDSAPYKWQISHSFPLIIANSINTQLAQIVFCPEMDEKQKCEDCYPTLFPSVSNPLVDIARTNKVRQPKIFMMATTTNI